MDDLPLSGSNVQDEQNTWLAHHRLPAILAQAAVAISEISPAGRFTQVNDELCRILARSRNELLTLSVANVTHPEDVANSFASFRKVLETGEPISVDKRYLRPSGEIIWADSRLTRITDDRGKTIGVLAVTFDLTVRQQTEAKLRRSETSLINAQRIARLGSWDWDVRRNRLIWSQELLRMFDFPLDQAEVPFADWLAAIHPDDLETVNSAIEKSFSDTSAYDLEYRIPKADGSIIIVHAMGELVRDAAGQPIWAHGTVQDITALKKSEENMRRSELHFSLLVTATSDALYRMNADWSEMRNLKGMDFVADSESPNPHWLDQYIPPEDHSILLETVREAARTKTVFELEHRVYRQDGSVGWTFSRAVPLLGETGEITEWFGAASDITVRREAEEKLRQSEERLALSQKLESVGRLAGGIAHDFNNMLTVILGYSDRSLRVIDQADPVRKNIEEIRRAGARSAELTQQLLAFSRKQVMQIREVCLNQIVRETTGLLERLIGENIRLSTRFGNRFSLIAADPGQMAQVIINLAVNARDAMPSGGDLTIETANIEINAESSVELTFSNPGAYVRLAVSDTGTGIDEETKAHIFEPFYTTKEVNKGTGLGLATVYGIVKQLNGYIWVASEIGRGTTFSIYLPRVVGAKVPANTTEAISELPNGKETILLVEDEGAVRKLVSEMLAEWGYQVIEAASGEEAMTLAAVENCHLDLLLTDVVMPGMSGRELADKIKEICPDVKVLFASGYTDDSIFKHGITEMEATFIQKPFDPEKLSRQVSALLNEK